MSALYFNLPLSIVTQFDKPDFQMCGGCDMVMRHGESWHCTNRSCNAAILVQAESRGEGANPPLHLWRRNEKDVPDPRFSLFGFSSRRNSCSGRAFALHPFTLQNERRIDHGDFFPSSRLRVPEGAFSLLRTFFLVPDSPLG